MSEFSPDAVLGRMDGPPVSPESLFESLAADPTAMPGGNPEQWQQGLVAEIATIAANAAGAREAITALVVEVETKAVALSLNSAGGLISVAFRPGARGLERDELNQALAEAIGQARAEVDQQVQALLRGSALVDPTSTPSDHQEEH